ncbi:MAG: leucine--tRNA ligase [Phycisphaerae bacterium]
MPGYNPASTEKKWQQFWSTNQTYATNTSDHTKPKFYALDMFPYPSGQGLHVGHPEGYTATDILSRYKRAKGFNVMHPMGWDAFGLPAEQYAIKNNVHPRETTANNINRFRTQLQSLGFSYDWSREVDTTDPNYYQWTQWIFLKLYDTWFDEDQQKGRPISELIAEFQSGKRPIPPIENRKSKIENWTELSPTEQRQILAKYRLAYESEVPVNWCPGLGTVLANEEVIDGKSELGGVPVERRPMRQWMLRITAYAKRLIDGLEKLEWSDSLKEMQRNWIGQSEGAEVVFQIAPGSPGVTAQSLTVFTTRPDTLFGATYMVIAPEHPLANSPTPDKAAEVQAYQKWAASRSDRERQEDTKKTGVFTGLHAINPVNNKQIPIWVSDYVLMGYGTGAIMAVPAHDDRDHEFATKFKLPIIQVVAPAPGGNPGPKSIDVQKSAFTEEGIAVNSSWIENLPTQEAKKKITSMLEEKNIGKKTINYKIRDWLFSRQRYWGEPFPIVHLNDGTTVPLADSELPLKLPELQDFKPTGTIDPPLSKAKEWVNIHVRLQTVHGDTKATLANCGDPDAIPARRELNTMPQWAGSCWYYIRYLDPKNSKQFVYPQIEKYWLHNGVDLYVGGVEHAVLHLLYSRFWHKVLFDWNLVSSDEPFRKLVNQGLILGEAEYTTYRTESGGQRVTLELVDLTDDDNLVVKKGVNLTAGLLAGQKLIPEKLTADQVEKRGEHFILKEDPAIRIDARSFKMSKSRGNVVNPDDVIKDYGADALRMFEMFMGPLEQVKPWSTAGVEGVYRFLQRVWRNLFDENDNPKVTGDPTDEAIKRPLHRLIKRVGDDIERLSFNTAIAAMMEFNNTLAKAPKVTKETALTFMRLLEPFAPHFAEEVYSRLSTTAESITRLPWPTFDPALLVDATLEIPVQVNGKLRSRITIPNDADEATAITAALADPEVMKFLAGAAPKKKIYVKGRMVNLVV